MQGTKIEIVCLFSGYHAHASALFARKAWEIETNRYLNDPSTPPDIISEHTSYVVGSLFASVAFLEAYINELYCEAERGGELAVEMLNHDTNLIDRMRRLWRRRIPRTAHYSILDKYEITLDIADKPGLHQGSSPYQDVQFLIKLRNSLMHYEPEPILHGDSTLLEADERHNFEKQFNNRFKLNPLVDSKDPFFPARCLSHGCAEWGLKSSIGFVNSFQTNMGLAAGCKLSDNNLRTIG